MMDNRSIVWNDVEERPATPAEIEGLIAEGTLFVNYCVFSSGDEDRGLVWADTWDADGFSLRSGEAQEDEG